MKILCFFPFLFVSLLAPHTSASQASESIDWSRIKGDRFLDWLENLHVPTASQREEGAVERSVATREINELAMVLQTVLSSSLNINSEDVKEQVVPIPNLRGKDDVLVLDRTTSSGRIVVQDGKMLNILLTPATSESASIEDEALKQFVLSNAHQILNIPNPLSRDEGVTFFISKIEIGKSKTGAIYYQRDSSDNWQWKHWYSAMQWWSDGKEVMFQIDKFNILHPEVDRGRMATPPKEHEEPRRFGRAER